MQKLTADTPKTATVAAASFPIVLALSFTHFLNDMVQALLPGMKEGNAEFDARGVVTVLHGPPKLRSVLNLPGISGNESWAYPDRLGGDTLPFHFVRPEQAPALAPAQAEQEAA